MAPREREMGRGEDVSWKYRSEGAFSLLLSHTESLGGATEVRRFGRWHGNRRGIGRTVPCHDGGMRGEPWPVTKGEHLATLMAVGSGDWGAVDSQELGHGGCQSLVSAADL